MRTCQVVKMLGVGGSGETWLCIDNVSKKQLAVKFIKRPIPAIILPMLKYEIKASKRSAHSYLLHMLTTYTQLANHPRFKQSWGTGM